VLFDRKNGTPEGTITMVKCLSLILSCKFEIFVHVVPSSHISHFIYCSNDITHKLD
jgi:hypothetical protein